MNKKLHSGKLKGAGKGLNDDGKLIAAFQPVGRLILILPSPLCSYMTTTFVIEAMAAANAQLRWKRREQEEVRLPTVCRSRVLLYM